MNASIRIRAALAVGALLFAAIAAAQESARLTVTRTDAAYVLSVPVSRLEMTVPAGTLVHKPMDLGGSTSSPRYFYFSDSRQSLILSGWFEHSSGFKGLDEFWEAEHGALKRNPKLPPAMNISKGKVGPWQTVFYDHQFPIGLNSHVRAQYVAAGTWIDLHISVTSAETSEKNRSVMESFLKSIAVKEKEGR